MRRYLDDEGFLEVETPVLQPLYGGAAGAAVRHPSQRARSRPLPADRDRALPQALIVGGLERVYELGKDFRNEGVSFKHNPEFTMVEWYEAYADYEDDDAPRRDARRRASPRRASTPATSTSRAPWRRVTLREAILEATGIDVLAHASATRSRPRSRRRRRVDIETEDLTWPALVDDLLSKYVEPAVTDPVFVIDYPKELSPFAKDHRSEPGLVERFEAFASGWRSRTRSPSSTTPTSSARASRPSSGSRSGGDEEAQPYDEVFVEALEHGMPPTGGVGLGIDRLVMLMTGKRLDPRGRAVPGDARLSEAGSVPADAAGVTLPTRTGVPARCDVAVVGAGIVGLAVAREALLRRPGSSVVVLERGPRIAGHQSSHNSGVIHAGIYYEPGR